VKESEVERLFGDPAVLLGFMRRTRKAVFHNSNIFYRDIQYAIKDYYDAVERRPIPLTRAAEMAQEVIELYTDVGLLRQVANQAYLLTSPEWSTPRGGTYSMLTIHGAPLPEFADSALELAIAETPGDRVLYEQQDVQFKGGDVSPAGATIAALQQDASVAPVPEETPGVEHRLETVGTQQVETADTTIVEPEAKEGTEQAAPTPPWLRKNEK
jgi:hypothetical protein